MTTRAAVYTRVSTTDKGQTVDNQLLDIQKACQIKGWDIAIAEQDYISGAKANRPGLMEILACANRKEFDVLVVWSLDRLTREGAFRALEIIQNLTKLGIGFHSLQEPHFDTCGPFKDAIIAIAATLAKMERERISERVKAGLKRTVKSGTVLGPKSRIVKDRILELAASGATVPVICSSLSYETAKGKVKGPSRSRVYEILKESGGKAA